MLAVESYRGVSLHDSDNSLNLTWTRDERGCLEPEITEVLNDALKDGLVSLAKYAVDDPYGEESLIGVVCRRFDIDPRTISISCGAGVGALIAACAQALAHKVVGVPTGIYPDFAEWLGRSRGRVLFCSLTSVQYENIDAIFFERPNLIHGYSGAISSDEEEITKIARIIAPKPVIIDESNANYMTNSYSLIKRIPEFENIVVLRGVSKAYSMGSLRVGYAVTSESMSSWLRRALPPLQVSAISGLAAARILSLPQVVEMRLISAIATSRAEALRKLSEAGIAEPLATHPQLPYVLYDPVRPSHTDAIRRLNAAGIIGKSHAIFDGGLRYVYRFAIPLNPSRKEMLDEKLRGVVKGASRDSH